VLMQLSRVLPFVTSMTYICDFEKASMVASHFGLYRFAVVLLAIIHALPGFASMARSIFPMFAQNNFLKRYVHYQHI
jgi:hypothetical protein